MEIQAAGKHWAVIPLSEIAFAVCTLLGVRRPPVLVEIVTATRV